MLQPPHIYMNFCKGDGVWIKRETKKKPEEESRSYSIADVDRCADQEARQLFAIYDSVVGKEEVIPSSWIITTRFRQPIPLILFKIDQFTPIIFSFRVRKTLSTVQYKKTIYLDMILYLEIISLCQCISRSHANTLHEFPPVFREYTVGSFSKQRTHS